MPLRPVNRDQAWLCPSPAPILYSIRVTTLAFNGQFAIMREPMTLDELGSVLNTGAIMSPAAKSEIRLPEQCQSG